MKKITQTEALSFNGLGIAPKLLEILTDSGFKTPTPIQSQSIPVSLEGKDMVGIAQTGTGKTLAFGIPMIQLIAIHKGMGLVVLPTRELALQVDENLKIIGKKIGLRTAVLIGGEPINNQMKSLKLKPHIIVATPGRLTDHTDRKTVDLSNVKILVLDEADMMLDMGFLPQIKTILKLVPKKRQTMLFSATMPNEIVKIASEYMSLPTRIEVAPAGTSAENVEQELIVLDKASKFEYLKKVLTETKGSVLIFMRTKHAVKTLTKKLALIGFSAAEIHSNRSLGQRRQALDGFKIGKYRILIATDIAARGIDVKEIELVINYDLPEKSGDYVHRIGRTARAGKSGKAISFVMPDQLKNVREIEKLINKTLKINKTPAELKAMRSENYSTGITGEAKASYVGRERTVRKTYRSDNKPKAVSKHSNVEQYNKKTFGVPTSYARKFKSFDSDKKRVSNNRSNHSSGYGNQNRSSIARQIPMTDKERFRRSMMGGGR